ncbi:MAG TPA: rhomboid family intramembrane serine protease [Labilithrix sp.]|nr:rhomboid family intramembrane serine protease [Labilithrix sp.]
MLIPYTHEDVQARRWPILTTLLVIANVFCFIALVASSIGHGREADAALREVTEYWSEHPTLSAPPVLEGEIEPPVAHRAGRKTRAPSESSVEQAHLEMLAEKFARIAKASPSRTWGYVPKEGNVLGLVTYQFLHGGILHLVFNMWFMWLCACNLEDRWGRIVFLPMYLSAGIVAALAHKIAMPESDVPLVGASGAIAGAMGAFLVLFAKTRIRFFYWYGIKMGSFGAPAWLMLPLWLAEEILWAVLTPGGGDGTAHVAHIGGFVYGALFAVVMLVTGWDRRLDAVGEKKVTVEQDSRILFAGKLIDEGRHAEALAALEAYVAKQPASIDAYLELLRSASIVRDERRMQNAYGRLVNLYLREGALDAAEDLHAEAERLGCAGGVGLATLARLADQLATANKPDRALRVYGRIVAAGVSDIGAAHACIAYARLLLSLGRDVEADGALDLVEGSKMPGFAPPIAELRGQVRRRAIAL